MDTITNIFLKIQTHVLTKKYTSIKSCQLCNIITMQYALFAQKKLKKILLFYISLTADLPDFLCVSHTITLQCAQQDSTDCHYMK